MADFEVSIGAKLGDALNNLAKLRDEGKITDKQFAQASKTIEKGFAAQSREAKKLAALLKKDVGQGGKAAFDSLKNAAEGFGGKIGGSVAMVEKFGKAAASIAGPLGPIAGVAVAGGLALAGLGVAGGLAAEKLNAAMNASVEFANKNADLIPPETLEALRDYDARSTAIANSLSTAAAVAAGEMAPGLETVQRLLLKGGLIATDFADDVVRGMAMAVDSIVLGLIPGLETTLKLLGIEVPSATAAAAKGMEWLDGATSDYDARVEALIGREYDKAEALRGSTEAIKEQTVAVVDQARVDQEAAEAWLEMQAQRAKFTSEIMALVEAENAAHLRTSQSAMAASAQAAQAMMAHAASVRQAWMSAAETSFAAVQNFGDLAIQNAQENDKISQTQAQRRISVAFAVQKTAAIAQAAITGAEAYLKMVAFLAPFSGPAALPIAAGIVGPLVTSQIAVIAAQKPPTFADGGMVGDRVAGDHVTVAADPSEGILTREGVANAGGPKGVADLNRGAMAAPVVHVYIDGVEVARALAKGGTGKAQAKALSPWLASRGV